MQVSLKKSVTLVELLISITLLGIIVLGATAFHLSSERFLSSSEKKTQVLNDLTFVLQHLHKNVLLGTGDYNNSGVDVPDAGVLTIRQDIDAAGNSNFTPADYGDDRIVVYTFGIAASPNSVMFSDDDGATWEELTRYFIDLGVPDAFDINVVNGGVEITNFVLRLEPGSDVDPSSNPEVTTIDTGGSSTVYFYPLAHSWQ